MYWLVFSAGAFLMVRYVDGSGCLVMTGYTIAASILRSIIGGRKIRRHTEAATSLRAHAASLGASDEAAFLQMGAKVAKVGGGLAIDNAEDWSDIVVGGAAQVIGNYVETLAVPEAAQPLLAEAAEHERIASDEDSNIMFMPFGVLAMSALWVALAHYDVIATPSSGRMIPPQALVTDPRDDDDRDLDARRRATASLRAAVDAYSTLPPGASVEARLASYRSISAAEDAWQAAHGGALVTWEPEVGGVMLQLHGLTRDAQASPSPRLRTELRRTLASLTAALRKADTSGGPFHVVE